jgi:hypothetical protein
MGGKRRIIVVVSILKSLGGLACHTYYGLFTNAYCLRDKFSSIRHPTYLVLSRQD